MNKKNKPFKNTGGKNMGMTTATSVAELKTIFNSVGKILFRPKEVKTTDLSTELNDFVELPVLGDGITFNTGEVEVTETKLTTRVTWTSKSERGDSDISMQVASVDKKITDMLLNGKAEIAKVTGFFNKKDYSGTAYSLSPNKVTGAFAMVSEDEEAIVVLPKVEAYASMVIENDKPAYFNMKVTPVMNSESHDIFLLTADKA